MQQHDLRGEKCEIPHLLQPGIMPANTTAGAMTHCSMQRGAGF